MTSAMITTLEKLKSKTNSGLQIIIVYRKHLCRFHICAGGHGSDSCQGDSGGPLAVLENGRLLLTFFLFLGSSQNTIFDLCIVTVSEAFNLYNNRTKCM